MDEDAYLGIMPGKNGGAAMISPNGHIVFDWPDDETEAIRYINGMLRKHIIIRAAIESVGPCTKKTLNSIFDLGCNLGQWMGILSAMSIPYLMPEPWQWQKGLVKKSDGRDHKTANLTVARRLFPEAELCDKRYYGRARAFLIADWVKRQG